MSAGDLVSTAVFNGVSILSDGGSSVFSFLQDANKRLRASDRMIAFFIQFVCDTKLQEKSEAGNNQFVVGVAAGGDFLRVMGRRSRIALFSVKNTFYTLLYLKSCAMVAIGKNMRPLSGRAIKPYLL